MSVQTVLARELEQKLEAAALPSTVVATLQQGDRDLASLLRSACALHIRGHAVDWRRILPQGRSVPLPTYAFQRAPYWLGATDAAGAVAPSAPGPAAARPSQEDPQGEALSVLVRQAAAQGEVELGLELLRTAAEIRRRMERQARADHAPAAVRLSHGTGLPHLVCFPSFLPPGSVRYDRFASHLRNVRGVWKLRPPGYRAGEPLAPDFATLVQHAAEAVMRCTDGGTFALVGHSSGGFLAHAVASHLEERGQGASALVLLDTPARSTTSTPLLERLLSRPEADAHPHVELTAMSWYLDLFRRWKPAKVAAPVLVVRPAGGNAHGARWPHAQAVLEVPGDHFSMLEDDVTSTARAVHDWLESR